MSPSPDDIHLLSLCLEWKRVTNTSGCDDETEGNDMNYFEFVCDLQDILEIV